MGSLYWLLKHTQELLQLRHVLYERGKKDEKQRNRGVSEHTRRADMTQEMLAKAQTAWDTETDRDKSL